MDADPLFSKRGNVILRQSRADGDDGNEPSDTHSWLTSLMFDAMQIMCDFAAISINVRFLTKTIILKGHASIKDIITITTTIVSTNANAIHVV